MLEKATCNKSSFQRLCGRDRLATPTEQFPEKLSGKRTAWLENLESGSNAHRRGYRIRGKLSGTEDRWGIGRAKTALEQLS